MALDPLDPNLTDRQSFLLGYQDAVNQVVEWEEQFFSVANVNARISRELEKCNKTIPTLNEQEDVVRRYYWEGLKKAYTTLLNIEIKADFSINWGM